MPSDPRTPYLIAGIIYHTGGTVAVSGTVVVGVNARTGELIRTTTNASGEYILDAANFTSGFNNSDVILVQAGEEQKEGQDVANLLSRDVIKQLKANWRSEFRNTLYTPNLIQNNPLPFEEEVGIFRRHAEISMNAIDTGE